MSSKRATSGDGVKGLSEAALDTGADGRNPSKMSQQEKELRYWFGPNWKKARAILYPKKPKKSLQLDLFTR